MTFRSFREKKRVPKRNTSRLGVKFRGQVDSSPRFYL
jgi:hypothetical protein